MAVVDVEWMFGDAGLGAVGLHALASLNPFRWSGSLDFPACLTAFHELQANPTQSDRPIIVKTPSGVTTPEVKCKNVAEAVKYITDKCPAHIRAELANLDAVNKHHISLDSVNKKTMALANCKVILDEAENTAREAKTTFETVSAVKDAVAALTCQWKYGDFGSGFASIGEKLAHLLIPLRCSRRRTVGTAKSELEPRAKDEKAGARPILLAINGATSNYGTAAEAVKYLEDVRQMYSCEKSIEPFAQANMEAKERLEHAKRNYERARTSLDQSEERAHKDLIAVLSCCRSHADFKAESAGVSWGAVVVFGSRPEVADKLETLLQDSALADKPIIISGNYTEATALKSATRNHRGYRGHYYVDEKANSTQDNAMFAIDSLRDLRVNVKRNPILLLTFPVLARSSIDALVGNGAAVGLQRANIIAAFPAEDIFGADGITPAWLNSKYQAMLENSWAGKP